MPLSVLWIKEFVVRPAGISVEAISGKWFKNWFFKII